jgi:hypothetical protein
MRPCPRAWFVIYLFFLLFAFFPVVLPFAPFVPHSAFGKTTLLLPALF